MMRIAVIGLGEAGALYASGLASVGQDVTGFDPVMVREIDGVRIEPSVEAGVDGASLVISLVGAVNAEKVVTDLIPHLGPGTVVADLNTSGPGDKRRMAGRVAESGADYLDVAVLAPVPRAGAATPLMISGEGEDIFRSAFAPTGAEIEFVDGGAGAAAERKLLRSVFMKGFAGVVLEALEGAWAAGCEGWMRGQILAELSSDPAPLIDRLETGSRAHASRRKHETADASNCLRELRTPDWMTQGAHEWFAELERRQAD